MKEQGSSRAGITQSLLLLILLVPSTGLQAGDPPPGPPWHMDYWEARSEALRSGTPIFIYFTKTY